MGNIQGCVSVFMYASYYPLQYTYTFNQNYLIGHLQGASSSYINALFLLDNIKSVLDTVNRFQLAVDNSRNNDFLYCIMLGLYMANWIGYYVLIIAKNWEIPNSISRAFLI